MLLVILAMGIIVLGALPRVVSSLAVDPSASVVRRLLLAGTAWGGLSFLLAAMWFLAPPEHSASVFLKDARATAADADNLDTVVAFVERRLDESGRLSSLREVLAGEVEHLLHTSDAWSGEIGPVPVVESRLHTSIQQTVVLAALAWRRAKLVTLTIRDEVWGKGERWSRFRDSLPPDLRARVVMQPINAADLRSTSPSMLSPTVTTPVDTSRQLWARAIVPPQMADLSGVTALSGRAQGLLDELLQTAPENRHVVVPGITATADAQSGCSLLVGDGCLMVCRSRDRESILRELAHVHATIAATTVVARDRLQAYRLHTWQDLRVSGRTMAPSLPDIERYRAVVTGVSGPIVLVGGVPIRGVILVDATCNGFYDVPLRPPGPGEEPASSLVRFALLHAIPELARLVLEGSDGGDADLASQIAIDASYVGPLLPLVRMRALDDQSGRQRVVFAAVLVVIGFLAGLTHALLLVPSRSQY